jgi:DNA-binding response OmpR family regulator
VVRVLAAAAGRTMDKGEIMAALHSDGEPKTVDVHLSRVRAARPDLGARIETVWGQGYRWTGPKLEALL